MKFIHLSDLHIGKRINEYSMIEDQEYILRQILNVIDSEKPDAVLIAGDVYDKSVPPSEAVTLFDDFLFELSKRNLSVFVISGNHDSPERIAFGSRLLQKNNVYLSPVYDGQIKPVILKDEHGNINIWMLPFVKPVHVRRYHGDEKINSYSEAVGVAINKLGINPRERNVLITHQFVTGSQRSDSEEISVGGTDNVDVGVFDVFDYTALGHIHRPQNCKSEKVRYCGTPLKYSFSEAKDTKSVTVAELGKKGELNVRTVSLVPMRDMVEIKGKYEEIMMRDFYKNTNYRHDYVHITLTDEDEIPDVMAKLRTVYHNIMKLDYDNTRTRETQSMDASDVSKEKTHFEYFSELFETLNNQPMSDIQSEYISKLIKEIWDGEQ